MSDKDLDTSTEETGFDSSKYVSRDELDSMASQLEEIRALNYQLMSKFAETQGSTTTTSQKHVEVDAASLAADPQKIAEFIKSQTDKAVKQVSEVSQKEIWDTKASKDFPLIETDNNFRAQVIAQMKDFVSSGEYSSTHPRLLFRAAELVASRNATKASTMATKSKDSDERETSIAPSSDSATISTTRNKSKVLDNDPRVRFYKLFKKDATKEDIERFKNSQLEGYDNSRRARRK